MDPGSGPGQSGSKVHVFHCYAVLPLKQLTYFSNQSSRSEDVDWPTNNFTCPMHNPKFQKIYIEIWIFLTLESGDTRSAFPGQQQKLRPVSCLDKICTLQLAAARSTADHSVQLNVLSDPSDVWACSLYSRCCVYGHCSNTARASSNMCSSIF